MPQLRSRRQVISGVAALPLIAASATVGAQVDNAGQGLLARLRLTPASLLILIAVVSLSSMAVCHRAGIAFAESDSGKIVLDEVCGMLVAGAWIVPTAPSLLVVFVLFRLFDVLKPFPARYLDREVRNGIGVVADDLVAGVYANLVARALI